MVDEFRQFLMANGLIPGDIPIGRITRCATNDRPKKKNGVFFFNGYSGWQKNFRLDEYTTHFKTERKIDHERLSRLKAQEEARAKRELFKKKQNEIKAAETARQMLSESEYCESMYAAIKGFPKMLCNMWSDETERYILVPMCRNGEVVSVQKIDSTGGKKFLYGTATKGLYFKIGQGGRTFLVEGWITGVTAHQALNMLSIPHNIIVCFSAYNLLEISKGYKNGFIIADNDKSGVGEDVAKRSGLPYYLPEHEGTDLNDEYLIKGMFTVSQRLRRAL